MWINSNGFLAFDGNSSTLALPFRAKDTKPNGWLASRGSVNPKIQPEVEQAVESN